MMKLNIPFTLEKDLNPSAWGFDKDRIFIKAGEQATVTGCLVAGNNPLYEVTNAEGYVRAIHRRVLVEHGYKWDDSDD